MNNRPDIGDRVRVIEEGRLFGMVGRVEGSTNTGLWNIRLDGYYMPLPMHHSEFEIIQTVKDRIKSLMPVDGLTPQQILDAYDYHKWRGQIA